MGKEDFCINNNNNNINNNDDDDDDVGIPRSRPDHTLKGKLNHFTIMTHKPPLFQNQSFFKFLINKMMCIATTMIREYFYSHLSIAFYFYFLMYSDITVVPTE